MASNYNQNLWNSVLQEIQQVIPQEAYELWFTNTKLVYFSNEKLRIQVPNHMVRQRLQENYSQIIKEAVFKCSGESPELEFVVVASEEEEGQRKSSLDPLSYDVGYYMKGIASSTGNVSPPPKFKLVLNPHYTFENFIVGPSNQLPHAASIAVADAPGKAYNPFFMHGAVGLGKTHLLQAICHSLKKRQDKLLIYYLSCESFINQFISAVEKGELDSFRYKYRHIDVLVIDDIHFLADKERTQEEFFHTFNTLYNAQKQIVLSSDSPPKEIPSLEERLVSRFKWGLEAKIECPGFETRVAIVKKKSKLKGRELPDDVCQYIAKHITTNIRELEGALTKILATSTLSGSPEPITLEFAKDCLQDLIEAQDPKVGIPEILTIVANHFQIKLSDLQSRKRIKSIVYPRQICMYLAKNLTNYSLQQIGGYFGGRDHSTVLHALEKIKERQANDPGVEELIKKFTDSLLKKHQEF